MANKTVKSIKTDDTIDSDFRAYRRILMVTLGMRTDKDFDTDKWRARRDAKGTAVIKAHVKNTIEYYISHYRNECQAWKETAEIKEAAIVERDKRISALQDALAFATGVIKSGKPWTKECERTIGAALSTPKPIRRSVRS